MKVLLRANLVLATILGLAPAYSQTASDKWYCRAYCVVVDQENRRLINFGSVKGLSEISTVEAFDLTLRKCENIAKNSGLNYVPFLVKKLRVSHSEASGSNEETTETHGRFMLFLGRLDTHSNKTSEHRNNSFLFDLSFADDEDCRHIVRTPGRPKYTGAGEPLS